MLESSYFIWFFSAFLYLSILTFQDFRNKDNLVDDRHNKFMLGLTVGLLFIVKYNLIYVLLMSLITGLLWGAMKKWHLVGEADINTFLWLFYGFSLINISLYVWFSMFLIILTIVYKIFTKLILKRNENPYYIVILLSYISTLVIFI